MPESTLSPQREKNLFFQRWLKNPLALGAVLPSSQRFSRFVAAKVLEMSGDRIAKGGILAEIGAGTGSFTQALLDAGLPKSQLVPIELDQNLFLYLQKRFPGLSPICGDARDLHNLLPPDKKEKLCAVVSGIPMITMPEDVQTDIINSAFALLKSEGLLYQFTYSPVSSIPAERFGLEKQRLGTVFMNVPPATVWCYRQTKASRKQ